MLWRRLSWVQIPSLHQSKHAHLSRKWTYFGLGTLERFLSDPCSSLGSFTSRMPSAIFGSVKSSGELSASGFVLTNGRWEPLKSSRIQKGYFFLGLHPSGRPTAVLPVASL